MARLLLVDDQPAMLFALDEVVRGFKHETILAGSAAQALQALEDVDLVLTDFAMPEMNGLELLRAVHARRESLPVVIITAQGSERVAVEAMKSGAYDYITKPFDMDELGMVIGRALETQALRVQNRRLTAERAVGRKIVSESPVMQRLLAAVERIAPKDVTVLIRGETGTGKELVASLLHAQSRRAAEPLVRFNCAAIPEELAEAELFGHTRGAFTGATQARRGFFAEANGGTLVLDEAGDLPAGIQAKLLRALQDGEVQPVGAGRVEHVDVRVLACTNRDLARDVQAGRFRQDLYYRLAVVELIVPPLRERREDIPALAAEFAQSYARRFGMNGVHLSPKLVARLQSGEWPGNVRELENNVARLVALSPGGEIPADALADAAVDRRLAGAEGESPPEGALTLKEQLEAVERNVVSRALTGAHGNQSEAARRLGLSRGALIDRLRKYGLLGSGHGS